MVIKRFTSSFLGMNSVFLSKNGNQGILIDPGVFPTETDRIKSYLNAGGYRVKNILLTHTHGDHISGCHQFSDAEIYVHESVSQKKESRRAKDIEFTKSLFRKKGFPADHLAFPNIDYLVREGETIYVDGIEAVFYHIPGHSCDQTAIIFPEFKFMVSGDSLISTTIPFILESIRNYMDSLEKIRDLVSWFHINQLGPGHANFAHTQEEIFKRIDIEENYLNHLVKSGTELARSGILEDELREVIIEKFKINSRVPQQHRRNVETFLKEKEYFVDKYI